MFTGIITDLGKLYKKNASTVTFKTDAAFCRKLEKGTSIAVNGTCLTITSKSSYSFSVEFMPETKIKTTLDKLQLNDLVNLELPLTPNSFLSGHIVQGHVDSVSKLEKVSNQKTSRVLMFSLPNNLSKYVVEKSSIAINGISLTVIKVGKNYFTVGIIPYTWNNTMLKTVKINDMVNIEVDILAKYIEKLLR